MNHGFEVVPCRTCGGTWILEDYKFEFQTSISCPHCDDSHLTKKVRSFGHEDTRTAAAERRSQINADRAGEAEVYQRFCNDHGQFLEQGHEVDRQLDSFVIDAAKMDLRPIGTERFGDLVSEQPIGTERFGDLVDEQPWYVDAFVDDVPDNSDGNIGREFIQDDLEEWAGEIDTNALPRGKVTPTNQKQITEPLEIGDEPVSDVWRRLFELDHVQEMFATGLETVFAEMDVVDAYDFLEERSIPFWIRSEIVAIARCDDAAEEFVETMAALPETPLTETDHLLATAALVAEFATSGSLSVSFDETFFDRDHGKRVATCGLLAVLASGLDVRVVGTGRELWHVSDSHRADLPGVSQFRNRSRDSDWFDDVVDEATVALNPDGKHVEILRELATEADCIMSRSALEERFDVSASRMTQLLTSESVANSLEHLQLIDVFGARGQQQIALRDTGQEVLQTFDIEIGRQQRLDAEFSSTGKSSQQCRRTPRTRGPPQQGRPYLTAYMDHDEHAAAAATAQPGAVTFVEGSLPTTDAPTGYHERPVSYRKQRDEAVVAPTATTPMQYTVTTALGLADKKFMDRALPEERISEIEESPRILSTARQIGPVTADSLDKPGELRDELSQWAESLEGMTDRLTEVDGEEREDLCSAILKSAKGLEGSIVHLLDAAGIDIIREVRVPADLSNKKLRSLAKSLGISAAISSTYGRFAAYRQLFDVPNSKPPARGPGVDAADPTGELIGSFVIRGPDAHRLRDDLEYFFANPRDLLDQPAEFSIDIPIDDVSRDAFQEAASRVIYRKRLRTTPEAISVFHALVETPHDLTKALLRLPREDSTRDMRADDVRYVLQTLDSGVLLADCGDAGKILSALLSAEGPLLQKQVADRAGVCPKTVRNHREMLQGLGLLQITDRGYRLTLSFKTSKERRSEVYPDAVNAELFIDVLDPLLETLLPPGRYGDPEDPVGGVLFWPPDPWSLQKHDELGAWLEVAAQLADADRPESETIVTMGPTVVQQPLPTAGSRTEVSG